MQVEMKHIKRAPGHKKKLMVWIDEIDVKYLEKLEPPSITVQSKIRQIITAHREYSDTFGEL